MAANDEFRHRPGTLKQQNKSHKTGRHRSKGQINKECQGRVSVKVISRKSKSVTLKQERRNHAQQIRKNKREEALAEKRSRGGAQTPPFLAAIVPLSADVNTDAVLNIIKSCDENATVITNDMGVCHISVPRFKQRFSFIIPQYGHLNGLLDAAKVSDTLVLLPSLENGIDEYGEYCMSCLLAQGMPATSVCLKGLKDLPQKKQSEAKKMIQKQFDKWLSGEKLHSLDTDQDGILLLRTIGSQKLKKVLLRDYRPHMIAEDVSFELDSEESNVGTLKVTGFIRGQPLSANSLVHLPGWGDFQMNQIDAPRDPYSINTRRKTDEEMLEDTVRLLEKADPKKQETLQSENDIDPMEGEQTWPTDEEIAQAQAEYEAKKNTMKKVPKGTSVYQAAWIVDDEDQDKEAIDEESDEDDDDDENMDAADDDEESQTSGPDEATNEQEDDEYETISMAGDDVDYKYDAQFDMEEEESTLKKYKEARTDEMFPDEIDTPNDTPARIRFQRYRGLKSFRTSPWDPKENLPQDYSRIFQFADFRRTKKRILNEGLSEGAMPGWYVTVHIAAVPRAFMESYKVGQPVILYGLLAHEQKMTVMHFVVKRNHNTNQPIKSKEEMIFHVGYRRFSACPVYSQHTNGDKHKFERFFRSDATVVATVYAPVMYPPASVMMFKENAAGNHELVATGSVMGSNPNRIISKRIVLSGHPFKINRKMAVIRYMFFNRDDIAWFKPVELRTKYGRRGHIREALGTHGHMKCVFDNQLTSMDTVLMNLYKRVYPKWKYNPLVANPAVSVEVHNSADPTQDMLTEELFD